MKLATQLIFSILVGIITTIASVALGMTGSFALATGIFAVGVSLSITDGRPIW